MDTFISVSMKPLSPVGGSQSHGYRRAEAGLDEHRAIPILDDSHLRIHENTTFAVWHVEGCCEKQFTDLEVRESFLFLQWNMFFVNMTHA